jgi:hypothetical protein
METSQALAQEPVTASALRSLASTIYKQLQSEGCKAKDIINVSTQLLDLVTTELQSEDRV